MHDRLPSLQRDARDATLAGVWLLQAPLGHELRAILGPPEDLKLRWLMTLFEAVAPAEPLFGRVLDRLCGARRNEATLTMLRAAGPQR